MAEVTAASSVQSNANTRGLRTVVTPSAGVIYQFYIDSGTDLKYVKSRNGGVTWDAAITVKLANFIAVCDVWFDKWTPNDTGNKIHIVYTSITSVEDTLYNYLDITTDTLGAEVVVQNGASYTSGTQWDRMVSITKARGGNLYITANPDGGPEAHFHRSTDGGGTWSSRTSPWEGVTDYMMLFPANTSDGQDILGIFWDIDAGAEELSVKVYDDSANTWTETAIGAHTNSLDYINMSGTVRHSDGHILLAAWNAFDVSTADLKFYDITPDALDLTGKITTKTDVISNADDCAHCAVSIDQTDNTIYVAYLGKDDGTETIGSEVHVFYKSSADGGGAWSAATQLATTLDDHRAVWADLGHSYTGLFSPTWFNDDLNTIVTDPGKYVTYGKFRLLTAGNDNTDASSYVTASITPGANKLILAAVSHRDGTATSAPSLSGNGLTWVQVDTLGYNSVATPLERTTWFRAMGASPSAGAVTITHTESISNCQWIIFEIDEVDTSGTNGSGAIVQTANNTDNANAGSGITVTLASFSHANNHTVGIFGYAATDTQNMIPGSGFYELSEQTATGAEVGRVMVMYRKDNDTSVDITTTNTSPVVGFATEIKAAVVAAVAPKTLAALGVGG